MEIHDSLASGGSIGLWGALTVLLIGLKLTGFINWPWVWVLIPIWGPITAVLVLFAMTMFAAVIILGFIALMDLTKR